MDRLKCRRHDMIITMMKIELNKSRRDDRIISPLRGLGDEGKRICYNHFIPSGLRQSVPDFYNHFISTGWMKSVLYCYNHSILLGIINLKTPKGCYDYRMIQKINN